MIGIKKLDNYIIQKFLLIFVGAFFVSLFVFMMQFTWQHVNDLVGKGLSMKVLGEFFWYMSLDLVPQALPISILLASLITFGNIGENYELLSIKAAGVSLMRTMRPLAVLAIALGITSFYFQNKIAPEAEMSLRSLLLSMKQQSPTVEIPEGVFYNGVPNINLYVQKKNVNTGMLYQTIIYKTDQGFDRAQIVLADSARLEMTRDKMHLTLDLWHGELFESLQGTTSGGMTQSGAEQPYDRETFIYKRLLIDFDSNFNQLDKDMLSDMPRAKNMKQLDHSVDSMQHQLDSVGHQYYRETQTAYFDRPTLSKHDSVKIVKMSQSKSQAIDFEKLLAQTSPDKMRQAQQTAKTNVQNLKSELEWKSMVTSNGDNYIRRHQIEWHKKITYSLACIIFFFVGAPLGAIIRKGGLGLPAVISILIFLLWYIFDISSCKLARDGTINLVLGTWISTSVIIPCSIFLSYKANNDSVVFNLDAYKNFLSRILGLRTKRHIYMKEVIINDPRMDVMQEELEKLQQSCRTYNAQHNLLHAPNYISTFFHYKSDTDVKSINELMESIVEELSNSRDVKVLSLLEDFPLLYENAHTSPFHSHKLNVAAGIVFPVGIVLWFRMWRFRLRLLRDMKVIVRTCEALLSQLRGKAIEEEAQVTATDEPQSEEAETPTQLIANNSKKKRKALRIAILATVIVVAIALIAFAVWRKTKRHKVIEEPPRVEKAEKPHNIDTSPLRGGLHKQ